MKTKWRILSLFMAVLLLLLSAGCNLFTNTATTPAGMIEVRFYLNDGTEDLFAVVTGNPGDNAFALGGVPERERYLFAGWYLDPRGEQAYNNAPTESLSVYAKWAMPIRVTFISENRDIADLLVPEGSLLTEPETPRREGYSFDGWFMDERLSREWDFDVDVVHEDMALFAGWGSQEFTVTLHLGDGRVTTVTTAGPLVERPETPRRDGHTFDGWFANEALTVAWDFASDTITGDLDLYARWQRVTAPVAPAPPAPPVTPAPPVAPAPPAATTFTVTFNSNGGSTVPPYVNVRSNSTINPPPNPARSGFVFVGWYRDSALNNMWNFPSDRVTGNITLFARWTSAGHTVTFNSNGGSSVASLVNVPNNSTIRSPANPTRSGHTFVGWYSDRALNNLWDFNRDRVRGNMTLHARWDSDRLTVTFDSNGGSTVPPYVNVQHNSTINPPAAPSRSGYEFVGWNRGNTPWNFATDRVRENITLTAQWSPTANVTVSFRANGGVNAPGPISGRGGTTVTLPYDVPTREGFTFLGWFVGTAFVGNAGTSYTLPMSDTVLTAQWTEIMQPDTTLPPAP